MSYGPATHHIAKAIELLQSRTPASHLEEGLLSLARVHLGASLYFVRRIHHGLHLWLRDKQGD